MNRRLPHALCAALISLAAPAAASAQTIIDEWANVRPPAAPQLKPVTVSPADTALLVLDFTGAQDSTKGPCNTVIKPRCIASLPVMQKLLTAARDKNMLVVYSVTAAGTGADIATALAPKPNDPVVKSGPDKYLGTDLGAILAGKNIKTIIVTGTASEGAVLDTATDAALKGVNVIIPVDGMSSTEPYAEQYVAWHMTHAPGVSQKTTLTKIDMISITK